MAKKITAQSIHADFRLAQRAAKRSHRSRSRLWMGEYLQAVYAIYAGWKTEGVSGKSARQLAKTSGIKRTRNTHPIRAIISATCPIADPKIQSRWTRALEYAASERVPPERLGKFLAQNGGLSGCARSMAKIAPKQEKVLTWE